MPQTVGGGEAQLQRPGVVGSRAATIIASATWCSFGEAHEVVTLRADGSFGELRSRLLVLCADGRECLALDGLRLCPDAHRAEEEGGGEDHLLHVWCLVSSEVSYAP